MTAMAIDSFSFILPYSAIWGGINTNGGNTAHNRDKQRKIKLSFVFFSFTAVEGDYLTRNDIVILK